MSDAATNTPSPDEKPQRGESKGGGTASGGGGSGSGGGKPRTFQAPKGTRDFYPQDLLRRRYIIDTWRRVSLRHGFEEIDGPTFEDSALYTVKSGEGILNELFGAYSGKDPNDTKQVQAGGPPPFALRPEFTPTLARMYAARAKQLPQPTKWFCVSNFFRAERPQRGRLREFWQWNADVLGDVSANGDADLIACCISGLEDIGLDATVVQTKLSHREALETITEMQSLGKERGLALANLLDKRSKLPRSQFLIEASKAGFDIELLQQIEGALGLDGSGPITLEMVRERVTGPGGLLRQTLDPVIDAVGKSVSEAIGPAMRSLANALNDLELGKWCAFDASIVRGLAYYTGTVFELIAEGERAVAGGGRYDKLIELFGGPPTPAVGFGMGDVVLTNLLDDRKLMPEGKDLLEATSRPLPTRPDVFVIANEAEDSQAKLVPLVASLRRGVETDKYKQGDCKPWSNDRYATSLGGTPPLHARRSYKATKNIGKLLSEATACHARYALIIENAETGTLKNMDTGEQTKDVPLANVGEMAALG